MEGNQLSGTIPSTIGSLTNLKYLYDCNSLFILTSHPSQIPNSSFVSTISYLYSNQLLGTIPSTIGSLINLLELYEYQTQPLITKSGRPSSDYSVSSRRQHSGSRLIPSRHSL